MRVKVVALLQIFFLVPMDWLMECAVHEVLVGTTVGEEKETFTDLDFANEVTLFTEMLSVLVLALQTRTWKHASWRGGKLPCP